MTLLRAASILSVAVALGVGLVEAPRLLEPGRSERDGVRLAPEAAGNTAADADWTYPPLTTTVHRRTGSFTVEARVAGLQLISRPLALVEGKCYAVRLLFASGGDYSLAVLSGSADEVLVTHGIEPSSSLRPQTLTFSAGAPRLSLGVIATKHGSRAVVGPGDILPISCDRLED